MIPLFILVLYAIVSTITFLTYAIDKSAAKNGRWRISEATLHLMSLLGGWPGALIAQKTLRHKSQKASFRRIYALTVLLNVAITAGLLTSQAPEQAIEFLENVLK